MSQTVIKVENISKQYRLGSVSTGTLSHDFNRWWHRVRGKEDPYLRIGETNDRTQRGDSDYVWALEDIGFKVAQGEVLGIIGRNGAGKSTLLKILSRTTSPTKGNVKIKGRVASLLEVGTGFHPELSGRENIFLNGAILGMTKREITAKFDEIVDFAGVERYIDTPVKRYSSGMYVRLAFAVAAHLDPEILIVDEVLAVGDAEFQKKAMGKMKRVSVSEGRTVLIVSHNLMAIKSLCSRSILLANGRVKADGDTDNIIEQYLKSSHKSNFKSFTNQPLTSVCVYQEKETIKIEAHYDSQVELDVPNLGFVIYDAYDVPICGSNPALQNDILNVRRTYKKGKVEVTITSAILLDGEYHASIWFGDSKKNHFQFLDCLYFEIFGMSKDKQLPSNRAGSIVPKVIWKFS